MTDSGMAIWNSFFDTPPEKTPLSAQARQLLTKTLIFKHRTDISRVIFLSASLRGANMATGFLGRLGHKIIGSPPDLTGVGKELVMLSKPRATDGEKLKSTPNSINALDPNNRFVTTIDKIPLAKGIPYHSIIGDRGKGGNLDQTQPESSRRHRALLEQSPRWRGERSHCPERPLVQSKPRGHRRSEADPTATHRQIGKAPSHRRNRSLKPSPPDDLRYGSYLRGLSRRPVRTGLTLVGISIGIAAVVALVGMASGYEKGIGKQLDVIGIDLVVSNMSGGILPKVYDASLQDQIAKLTECRQHHVRADADAEHRRCADDDGLRARVGRIHLG